MRLWSLHPSCLDAKGLVALWREGLLAKKVLQNKTRGYKHHPQLIRFKDCQYPVQAINQYLNAVCEEAAIRGYSFDTRKVNARYGLQRIPVSSGQLKYELLHLKKKLKKRDPAALRRWKGKRIKPHPMFRVVKGNIIEAWEVRRGK